MRREMCSSALTGRAGRCPYTVSSIVYDRKDPLIAVSMSQLRTWLEAWNDSDGFRRRIRRGPAFSRASQTPHRTGDGDTHTDLSGASSLCSSTTAGTPHNPNDGHPPTARPFSSPSQSSSPIQAHSFEASLWADFWLAADNG